MSQAGLKSTDAESWANGATSPPVLGSRRLLQGGSAGGCRTPLLQPHLAACRAAAPSNGEKTLKSFKQRKLAAAVPCGWWLKELS